MPSASPSSVDVVIVGAGAAGLAAGISLAQAGWRTAVLGEAAARRDGRTVALMDGSVRFLRDIGSWPHIAESASPLETLAVATGLISTVPDWLATVGAALPTAPAFAGLIHLGAGLAMAGGQLIGGRLGAGLVVTRGARFVRPLFFTMVALTLARLIWVNYLK